MAKPSITLKVKGFAELRKQLNKSPEIVAKHIRDMINNSIEEIEARAKPITPVKTGRLVNSYALGREQATSRMLTGKVSPSVNYALSVHDLYPPGTRYKRPSKNRNAVAGFLAVGTKEATPQIGRFIKDAGDQITRELANKRSTV